MISFVEIANTITDLAPPRIAEFYAKFPDDPWQLADDDLREVIERGDRNAIDLALISYEARKVRLIELYKEFQTLCEVPIAEARAATARYSEERKLQRLTWVACDLCGKNAKRTKALKVFMGYVVNAHDEPESVTRCVCENCEGYAA
jgi:DNA-binding transcriptional LysR family regulator